MSCQPQNITRLARFVVTHLVAQEKSQHASIFYIMGDLLFKGLSNAYRAGLRGTSGAAAPG
jgi:hypothetical protein